MVIIPSARVAVGSVAGVAVILLILTINVGRIIPSSKTVFESDGADSPRSTSRASSSVHRANSVGREEDVEATNSRMVMIRRFENMRQDRIRGNDEQSLAELRELYRRLDYLPDVGIEIARVLAADNRSSEAIELYETIVIGRNSARMSSSLRTNARVLVDYADLLRKVGRSEDAVRVLAQPQTVAAAIGKVRGTDASFREAHRIVSERRTEANLYRDAGIEATETSDYAAAERYLTRARQLDSQSRATQRAWRELNLHRRNLPPPARPSAPSP